MGVRVALSGREKRQPFAFQQVCWWLWQSWCWPKPNTASVNCEKAAGEHPPEPLRPSQCPSSDETQAPLAVKSRLRGFGFYKNEVFTRASKKLTLAQTSSNLKGCTTLEKNKTILRNETSEGVTALQERGVGHWSSRSPKWPPEGSKDIDQRWQGPAWGSSWNYVQQHGRWTGKMRKGLLYHSRIIP